MISVKNCLILMGVIFTINEKDDKLTKVKLLGAVLYNEQVDRSI